MTGSDYHVLLSAKDQRARRNLMASKNRFARNAEYIKPIMEELRGQIDVMTPHIKRLEENARKYEKRYKKTHTLPRNPRAPRKDKGVPRGKRVAKKTVTFALDDEGEILPAIAPKPKAPRPPPKHIKPKPVAPTPPDKGKRTVYKMADLPSLLPDVEAVPSRWATSGRRAARLNRTEAAIANIFPTQRPRRTTKK